MAKDNETSGQRHLRRLSTMSGEASQLSEEVAETFLGRCSTEDVVAVEEAERFVQLASTLERLSRELLADALEVQALARALTLPPAGDGPLTVDVLEALQRAAYPHRDRVEARAVAEQCIAQPTGFASALELERARFALDVSRMRETEKTALRRYADALALLRMPWLTEQKVTT